jgi:hypothetical protein
VRCLCLALPAGLFASRLVDDAQTRGPEQPAARIRRDSVARPVLSGGEERLLDRVISGVEVARSARERGEDLRRQLAQQVLDIRRQVQRALPTCWR